MIKQQTIKYPVSITGYGLQSGQPITCKITPAPANTGILFFPANGKKFNTVRSDCNNITKCILSTDIGNGYDTISTIEHLMSALHALSIDNAKVTLSGGNEIPILDGSSAMWYTLITSAGVCKVNEPRCFTEVSETIKVKDEQKWIKIEPHDGLIIDCTINFEHPAIMHQHMLWDFSKGSYYHDISLAKTFGFKDHINKMKKMGYLKGGDKDTAIILNKWGVISGELRYTNEFVRHKLLDLIGDIYINGAIKGYITSYCSGHNLNSKLMKAIHEQTKRIPIREGDT